MTIIFHIDVNSAFLSWSALATPVDADHPDLRTIPSIVGGDEATRHGIVLAKSIPAKRYGIHTAEPVSQAMRKCPGLVVVKPDHALYRRRSRELMDLLRQYTPDIEQVSVDECFLDFGPIAHRFETPVDAADQIRARVKEQLGFTVNVGISVNKLLAKMASDFKKPDRTHTLFPDEVPAKMWPLPVDELFMVGPSTAGRLHSLGIHTIGELANTDVSYLETMFHSFGKVMHDHANGIGSDQVRTVPREAKGIGNSTTLATDLETLEEMQPVLRRLCGKVAERMERAGVLAGCVMVEVKYSSFVSTSHQTMLPSPISGAGALYQQAEPLLEKLWNGGPVRLLGVRVTHLKEKNAPVQMTIFDLQAEAEAQRQAEEAEAEARRQAEAAAAAQQKRQKAEAAADTLRRRFGAGIIQKGGPSRTPNLD